MDENALMKPSNLFAPLLLIVGSRLFSVFSRPLDFCMALQYTVFSVRVLIYIILYGIIYRKSNVIEPYLKSYISAFSL